MKTGDYVVFTERGQSFIATVLGVRELDAHGGKNGEPLLHLGFFAPAYEPDGTGKLKEVSLVGTHRQDQLAQFRVDIAHQSHEFDPKLKLPAYPGGRWSGPILASEDVHAEKETSIEVCQSKPSEVDPPEGSSIN
jgi:hypothetical protein